MDEIVEWLDEEIPLKDENRHQSHAIAPNSYGAGYDQGYYDALREVRLKIAELAAAI
jgi:hypothetical protein